MDREFLGTPKTVGELRKIIDTFVDHCPLAVCNGPLPNIYDLICDGKGFFEVEIPQTNNRLIDQLIDAMHGLCKSDDTIWLNPGATVSLTMFEHLWNIAVENGGEDRLKNEFPEYA